MNYATIFKEEGVTDESVKKCCDIAIDIVFKSIDKAIRKIDVSGLADYLFNQVQFETTAMRVDSKNKLFVSDISQWQLTTKQKEYIEMHENLHKAQWQRHEHIMKFIDEYVKQQ